MDHLLSKELYFVAPVGVISHAMRAFVCVVWLVVEWTIVLLPP